MATPSTPNPGPETDPPFAAPPGSETVDAARLRLVGAACQYAAGCQMMDRWPDEATAGIIRATVVDVGESLARAAKAYYRTVTGESPNDKLRDGAPETPPLK